MYRHRAVVRLVCAVGIVTGVAGAVSRLAGGESRLTVVAAMGNAVAFGCILIELRGLTLAARTYEEQHPDAE